MKWNKKDLPANMFGSCCLCNRSVREIRIPPSSSWRPLPTPVTWAAYNKWTDTLPDAERSRPCLLINDRFCMLTPHGALLASKRRMFATAVMFQRLVRPGCKQMRWNHLSHRLETYLTRAWSCEMRKTTPRAGLFEEDLMREGMPRFSTGASWVKFSGLFLRI